MYNATRVGSAQSTANLQAPTNATGFVAGTIYAEWANAYCNPTTGAYMEVTPGSEPAGFQSVWDLGNADEYPALTCFPNFLNPAEQRIVRAAALAGDSPFTAYNSLPSKQ